jgi:trehalose 6-phosphate synthase/phosphatase
MTSNKKTISSSSSSESHFLYRYEIHRAGVFYRWENASDATLQETEDQQPTTTTTPTTNAEEYHALPLHLLAHREIYTVNDVLGNTHRPVDIQHVPIGINPKKNHTADENNDNNTIEEDVPLPVVKPQTLHTRASSGSSFLDPAAFVTLRGGTTASASPAAVTRKKAVGFAPTTTEHPSLSPRQPTNATPTSASFTSSKHMVHLNSTDGLVVVSMFLPVILQKQQQQQQASTSSTFTWHADWDYEMLLSMQTHLRVTRVGVVKWRDGNDTKTVPIAERRAVEECLRKLSCVPVWIDETLLDQMYNGFCKGVLWPVLHNVTSVYSSRPDDTHSGGRRQGNDGGVIVPDDFEQISDYCMDDVEQGPIHGGRGREAELWSSYNTVNRRFAEIIVQCFNEGDLVWIHGFQLLILPSYLTRRIPMAKVGIFLHTPFPSSEIFRTLWCREDLLRGMLNADQVGFHLFEYARHFLTSCRRLLGLNYGMIPDASGGHTLAIDTNGRHVVVTSIHAGVEPPVLNQILFHSSTVEKAATIRERVNNQHIFCGIDKLESLKGIPLKLLGLERFLRRCPEYVGKVVLVQVGLSALERGEDYVRTKHEVSRLVEQINAQWPNTVQFQECSEAAMGLQQRMALLRAADTVIVTSIRDGLNLLPLEYTIAHQDALTEYGRKDGRKRGMVILSEFSSCTRVMRGALHVNPYKISEIANALHSSLNIAEDERLRRISIASEFVTRVTTQRWALAVMLDLKGVHKNMNPVQYSGAGLGLGYRLLGMDTGFNSLDTNLVAKAYRNAKARLILVDYGGTIVSNDNVSIALEVLQKTHLVKVLTMNVAFLTFFFLFL